MWEVNREGEKREGRRGKGDWRLREEKESKLERENENVCERGRQRGK